MEQNPPSKQLDPIVIKYDKAESLVSSLFSLIICSILIVITLWLNWPTWLIPIYILMLILITCIDYFILPALRLRSIRYEVHASYLEIMKGIFFKNREIIPIERIQHVKIAEGPLSRMYDVRDIKVYTAGTSHDIPLLLTEEAIALHDQIFNQIKEVDSDV